MREIERIHSLSREEIRREELERLKKLVRYAYEHTQYYRELFQREGINPDDIQSIEDIERIPFLTKDLLRENRKKMISDEFKSNDLIYITTSGSTGAPTGFYVQKDSHLRDLAYGYFFFESTDILPAALNWCFGEKSLYLREKENAFNGTLSKRN